MASEDYVSILGSELQSLEGIHIQNPETGVSGASSQLGTYSNRLFGAPYQLLDSVDKRFPSINSEVGTEYLRHFLLHSPILHIKPGMAKYTGGDDSTSIVRSLQNAYGSDNPVASMLTDVLGASVLKGGSKLQRRMYGFRETYLEFMHYVNYMCHSVASFMGLTDGDEFPNGTFTGSGGFESFSSIRWENYRMTDRYVNTTWEQAKEMLNATGVGATAKSGSSLLNYIGSGDSGKLSDDLQTAWENASNRKVYDVMANKVTSFQIMVEPVSFSENLSNSTDKSMLESTIDSMTSGIGSEIAFITNSGAGDGIIGDLTSFLGNGLESVTQSIGGMVEPVTGGFMNNLFHGAIQSIKGQKMIYPDIYKSSNSSMDYEFSVTLTSPYGDKYNYYMNIVVPLCHLIALAAPRMVTSNTTSSPFLVQAYIPGMCTCQLGIISQMNITKNRTGKHVSVNGYPLTVTVNFTIKELYNAMAISPETDPASFMFNETLNDYLANMAGLVPSMDTYHTQRETVFENMQNYFSNGQYAEDVFSPWLEGVENLFSPRSS